MIYFWVSTGANMAYRKKDLLTSDRDTLINIIQELQGKLKQKNIALRTSRTRLNTAKEKMTKMKDTVEYQRQRIIQLHS